MEICYTLSAVYLRPASGPTLTIITAGRATIHHAPFLLGVSSNGRTCGLEPRNGGSIPPAPNGWYTGDVGAKNGEVLQGCRHYAKSAAAEHAAHC